MWRVHTSLLVILAIGVSPLPASQQQKSKVLSHCPSFTAATLSRENKVPLPAKQNIPVLKVSAKSANGGIKLDSVIEVSADITTNQIWTAGNIYHITADISVQALLVIEPGTTVEFAYDTAMFVADGGVLISCGTPDNPIIYTSDSATPDFGDYYCPIYIEETASRSTKVTYSYIEYAYVGIFVINNRLDSPIENNYFCYNSYGIAEAGTALTDIQNNLLYYSDNAGIDVSMASGTGQGNANSSILIANNTCDSYQIVGIIVRGVANPDEAGQPVLSNNVVSQSYYYGIALVNGYMYYTLSNTGYYGNPYNTYDAYDETNPVIETTMPYVTGTGVMPYFYLSPNSTFVNASDEYIEQTQLIGKTTDIDGFPDSNKADLGFHYPNWHFSNAGSSSLTADFDNSYIVDFNDLSEFVDYWLYDYNDNYNCWSWDFDDSGVIDLVDFEVIANYWLTHFDFVDFADFANYWRRDVDYRFQDRRFDFNGDGFVDFKDFVMFTNQWRQTTDNHTPPIAVTFSGDPNNLTGKIDFGISGRSPQITKGFIYVDGELKGYTKYSDDPEMANEFSSIDTQKTGNGRHNIKAVTIDSNGLIILSQTISVDTNNVVYNITQTNDFNQGEDYHIYAMSNSTSNLRVRVLTWDGTDVWTSSISSGGLNVAVPSSILTGPIYKIVIEMEGGALLLAPSLPFYDIQKEIGKYDMTLEEIWSVMISNIFPINDHYKVAIFLPNGLFKYTQTPTADCRIRAVMQLTYWCTLKNMKYIILYKGNCTWQNFVTVLSKSSVSYVYMVAHGSNRAEPSDPNSVHRLFFVVSGPSDDINVTERVYSYKGGLPGNLDTDPSVHSMEELGLGQSTQIRCVYMTVCYQGESDEMARQWIKWDPVPLDQLFCGWNGCVEGYNLDWQDWDYQFWCRWGSGDVLASDVINSLFTIHGYIWYHFAPIGWTQMLFTPQGNY
jgi:hypothetical protein